MESQQMLLFSKITVHAYPPVKATNQSAGFDLFSAYNYIVPPNNKQLVKTDLAVKVLIVILNIDKFLSEL